MAESFEGKISGILQEFQDTLQNNTKFNAAIAEDFGKMTYPAAQIIPGTSTYQNELEYGDTYQINFVFSKGPTDLDFISATEDVETAVDTLISNLETDTPAKEFKPTDFNFLFGENSGSRLSIVQVTFTVTRTIDFAS